MQRYNKIIFALVLIAVIAGVHFSGDIKKLDVKEFSESRLVLIAAISKELYTNLLEQILALLKLVLGLQQKLNALVTAQPETEVTAETPVLEIPEQVGGAEPAISLPSSFESTLKIEILYPSLTISSYGVKTLTEFRLSADEKIAITKIRFKNSQTLYGSYLRALELVNSNTGAVLATIDFPTNEVIEFNMVPDETKIDKGLMVSGNIYHIIATIIKPTYSAVKPKFQLDIESASDISAFDYNDLTREADISKSISFPITGPIISTSAY